jgi:hypothetical protein
VRRDDGKSVDRVSGGGGSRGVCTTWSVNAVCGGGSVNIVCGGGGGGKSVNTVGGGGGGGAKRVNTVCGGALNLVAKPSGAFGG